jgi:hydrogenase maturation protease
VKTLLYGIGNKGRGDDGLGVRCAELVDRWRASAGRADIEVVTLFQLNIEEAERLSRVDRVIFCDASVADVGEVALLPVEPEGGLSATTHVMPPAVLLGLCRALYGPPPEAHLLHLKGERFEPGEGFSERGERNLAEGLRRICTLLQSGRIEHATHV